MNGWIKNTGTQPVADGMLADIRLERGVFGQSIDAARFNWKKDRGGDTITHWRSSTTNETTVPEDLMTWMQDNLREIIRVDPDQNTQVVIKWLDSSRTMRVTLADSLQEAVEAAMSGEYVK